MRNESIYLQSILFIMRNYLKLSAQASRTFFILCILIFGIVASTTSKANDYLSAGEVAGLSLGSGALTGIGIFVKNSRTNEGITNWTTPLPGEKKIMHFLGGQYYPGKTNFLDNGFGSIVTSIAAVPVLVGINLKWPQKDKNKDLSQDLFLLSTGLLATNGVTELFKGIFRRERPFVSLNSIHNGEPKKTTPAFNIQSFFSGHSSLAFYTGTYLNLRVRTAMRQNMTSDEFRNWSWLSPTVFYGWATFVGWSRIHAYRHYPSDVLAGALIGSLLGELFYSLNNNLSSSGNNSGINKIAFIKINITI